MHDDDAARAIAMRMRVLFCRPAVSGPTRVTDAVSAVERFLPQGLLQVAQLAFGAPNLEVMIFVHDGNAGRVIATVFKLAQAVDYQRHDLFVSNVSDYSTHRVVSSEQLSSKQVAVSHDFGSAVSFFLIFAGTPATIVFGGTSSVTTEPAAVTAPLPTRTGATSIVSDPILTLSSITVGCLCFPS